MSKHNYNTPIHKKPYLFHDTKEKRIDPKMKTAVTAAYKLGLMDGENQTEVNINNNKRILEVLKDILFSEKIGDDCSVRITLFQAHVIERYISTTIFTIEDTNTQLDYALQKLRMEITCARKAFESRTRNIKKCDAVLKEIQKCDG